MLFSIGLCLILGGCLSRFIADEDNRIISYHFRPKVHAIGSVFCLVGLSLVAISMAIYAWDVMP